MSGCTNVMESQIKAARIRAQDAALSTLRRIGTVQKMFPAINLGSYFEVPGELPWINGEHRPNVAVFQNADILDPVTSWQHHLLRGGNIAPLAHETGTGRTMRVCLINAAHNERAGGDWQSAIGYQEDTICRRSTLYHALTTPGPDEPRSNFFPIEGAGGIYSPSVIIHRDGPDNAYETYETPDECTVISVASVPPERTPMLSADGAYRFELERELQQNKMKTALRIAANHGHRNIVIGSFGSVNREIPEYSARRHVRGGGAAALGPSVDERRDINPVKEVARMWCELLDDTNGEFAAHFDNVVFIVGVGQRSTEEAHTLSRAFKLPDVPALLKEWFPGEYDFAYMK